MDQSASVGLFAFDGGVGGIERLYDLNNVPQTRNSVLEAIFERTARSLKGSLRNLASDQIEVALGSIGHTRCRTYIESIPLPAIVAVVHAMPWGGHFLVVLSADLIYSLVETTLGGAITAIGPTRESRAFTTIETAISRRLIDALIASAAEAFASLSPVTFEFDHTETIPRFINIAPPSSVALLVSVSVRIGDKVTNVEILMPLSTLEPVRELLTNAAPRTPDNEDDGWPNQMRDEILRSHAKLEIVLNEETFPLSKIMALAVGETLLFDRSPDDPVEMRCDGVPIARGRAGHSGKRLAFKVQSLTAPRALTART